MSFTYDFNTAQQLSQVRMLIPDTDASAPIFSDDEINQMLYLTSSQGIYASGQAAPTAASQTVVPLIYSVRRAAAMGLDSIAARLARQSAIEQLLDVKQACDKAASAARESAKALREEDDNMGHFAIVEMVPNQFAARERVYAQLLRIQGGA